MLAGAPIHFTMRVTMTKAALYLRGTFLATSLMFTLPASAQEAPAAADEQAGGDIIVTAQKRPELLSKAPLSISAATGDQLKSAGITDASNLATVIPTVRIDQANGLQVTIRGVSSADGTEKGDPSAAFMLNGVYVARPQMLSGAFYDIGRVEVLRGPQGTLYGRNATAGVVNIIANRPSTDKFAAAVNAEYGNYDTYRVDAMVNVPLSDRIAVRAAGAYNKHDSYLIAGTGVGDHKLGQDQDEYAGRLSLDAKFGSDDQGELYIVGDYTHQGGAGTQAVTMANFYGAATTTSPVYLHPSSSEARTVNYPVVSDPYQDNKIYGVTAEAKWDFGPVNLTYLGSYRIFDQDQRSTYVNYNANRYAEQYQYTKNKSNSQELRLATSGDGPLTAVAGLYYFKEKSDYADTVLHGYAGFPLYTFQQGPVEAESKAAFGQATYEVVKGLRLTGGLRYSQDQKSRLGATIYDRSSSVIGADTNVLSSINDAARTDSKLTWKAGAEYDVTPDILTYGTVSTGYKAGGFNDGCAAGSPGCTSPVVNLYYNPEELTAYEVGVKGKALNRMITFSLAGFYYDYTNMQLSSPGLIGLTTLNAGKATIKGIETQFTLTPTSQDRVDLSINYLDGHYTEYRPTTTVDFAGRPLDNSPNWVVTAGYTHTFPLGNGGDIAAHVDTMISDDYYVTYFGNGTQFRNPSYMKSNANIAYNAPDDAYYISAFIKNIENSVQFSGYGAGRVYVSQPRVYGVRAGMKF